MGATSLSHRPEIQTIRPPLLGNRHAAAAAQLVAVRYGRKRRPLRTGGGCRLAGVAGRASRLPNADSLRASGGTSTAVPSRTVSVRAGRRVVVGVVNGRKGVSDLDGIGAGPRRIELKSILSSVSGREVSEFGTVRPRVQIPGPRPFLYSKSTILDVGLESADHRRVTVPGRTSQTRLLRLTSVSRSDFARHRSVAAQRLHAEDARSGTVSTVRHRGLIPWSGFGCVFTPPAVSGP